MTSPSGWGHLSFKYAKSRSEFHIAENTKQKLVRINLNYPI